MAVKSDKCDGKSWLEWILSPAFWRVRSLSRFVGEKNSDEVNDHGMLPYDHDERLLPCMNVQRVDSAIAIITIDR